MLDILLFTFAIAGIVASIYALKANRSAAPFLPVTKKTAERIVAIAEPIKGETLIDLGSGDGRILFAAANRGLYAQGVELHPFLHLIAKSRRFFSPHKHRITCIYGDLWTVDTTQANIVTLFFIKDKMAKLEKKLKSELAPGTRVVSYMFRFPGWQHEKKDGNIYLYRI